MNHYIDQTRKRSMPVRAMQVLGINSGGGITFCQNSPLQEGESQGMARSIESIQSDIANVAREIQELRRAQLRASRNDPTSQGKRIYELARELDALYAEKRSLHAPLPAPTLQVSERQRAGRRHGKAAEDLIARLFGGSLGSAVKERAVAELQRNHRP
jgi:hypothetical protein